MVILLWELLCSEVSLHETENCFPPLSRKQHNADERDFDKTTFKLGCYFVRIRWLIQTIALTAMPATTLVASSLLMSHSWVRSQARLNLLTLFISWFFITRDIVGPSCFFAIFYHQVDLKHPLVSSEGTSLYQKVQVSYVE